MPGTFIVLAAYSDIKELQPEHIKGNWIEKVIKKTKVYSRIPLNRYTLEFLNKYGESRHYPLPVISEQKLNNYIKESCKEVKIDEPTTITRFSGSKVDH